VSEQLLGLADRRALDGAARTEPGAQLARGLGDPTTEPGATVDDAAYDGLVAVDPGSFAHIPGCVAVLNEQNHKVILLIRNIPGSNLNASHVGVVGAFGQITFEVTHRDHHY
jgi:hypothetical protein